MKKDSIGNRMKFYEKSFDLTLPPRMPILVRLDGMTFHTLTRKLDKPFDKNFMNLMVSTTLYLCTEVPSTVLAYSQSDEISLLLIYYRSLESEPWFGNRVNKIISYTSAKASSFFNRNLQTNQFKEWCFDSRVWVMPEDDVSNYFVWRWKDWSRNSLSMVSRSFFSHKELINKKKSSMHEMLHNIGVNWATDYTEQEKNGTIVEKEETGWLARPAPSFLEEWKEVVKSKFLKEERVEE